MKSLQTLIKLQKTRVDEQRVHLANLQARLDAITNQIQAIEQQKIRERDVARHMPEAAATYGAFLKAATHKRRELDKARDAATLAVNAAHDLLIRLFEEQKRYEIAEVARREAEAKEERRQETIELDEIGSVQFERNRRT